MSPIDRRQFVTTMVLAGVGTAAGVATEATEVPEPATQTVPALDTAAIDFRYKPHTWQATFCFPDDPCKSLVGERGDLRYGFKPDKFAGPNEFSTIVEFSLQGMQADRVAVQKLQAPGVPIVHTTVERPAATMTLTTFATDRPSEGRVDNVIITITPAKGIGEIHAAPLIRLRTSERFKIAKDGDPLTVILREGSDAPFLVATAIDGSKGGAFCGNEQGGCFLSFVPGAASAKKPLRYFVRFPQVGQTLPRIQAGVAEPDKLLAEATEYWRKWRAFGGDVEWSLPERHNAFLVACARNIQQAREIKNGRSVFQVGPTVYRGLWIVDGNFLLEAARYLGYDKEAEQGLRAEWNNQLPSGQVVAGGGDEHWKDTAIAMFTLVRQCELAQDWSLFRELEPNVMRAVDFLVRLRDDTRKGNSTNGRYGLLAPGFPDGGIGGVRSEFTNTVWTLAGLRAVAEAGDRLGLKSAGRVNQFYQELRQAFFAAAKQEVAQHPAGFQYLPMLMKDDPAYKDPDPWARPNPQSAQWALSHAIFPGLVFDKNDPIVRGHISLMQWCTKEEIPSETGWILHEGSWNYGASFAAHVYLWAGLRDWAHSTFVGFLNHAAPMYCWREEQPLQNALLGRVWGDMPHNWASAECVRFLRHMLLLEDSSALRFVEGVTDLELRSGNACKLANTPTRFGRVTMTLEPLDNAKGWRLQVARDAGPAPQAVELPSVLGSKLRLDRVDGASSKAFGNKFRVDPAARSWTAYWS